MTRNLMTVVLNSFSPSHKGVAPKNNEGAMLEVFELKMTPHCVVTNLEGKYQLTNVGKEVCLRI